MQTETTPTKEPQDLQGNWVWFLVLGIGMVVMGLFAISWACLATVTVAATWLFGFVILASGISIVVHSFSTGRWSGMLLHLLIGIMYMVAGFIIIEQPMEAAINLTLVIAIILIMSGIFRMVFAMSERFTGWPWVLLNGGITLMMGMLIYKQWPASGLWVIGLFLGIDLIFNGWAWIMLSFGIRSLPKQQPS
ncbi:hypothetical protein C5Y96_02435 [Blastopirellula marina]|uniref:HdeD family acid-resistance protein n=1 Tax=Blastopirellula marina TaxID=124 RepID=A0A2S8G2T7_9BACT|nr:MULTISPECIES: HdeD family acid-resistance protein [Pirellulaceae]PQO38758.1 hypothetical protein C5Y96_02435 [Blastopirellula marina]RCS55066.1 HdeD family acid-resistance protein [Bremerella cremea]